MLLLLNLSSPFLYILCFSAKTTVVVLIARDCMYVCVFKTLKFHFLPFVKINQIRFSFAKKIYKLGIMVYDDPYYTTIQYYVLVYNSHQLEARNHSSNKNNLAQCWIKLESVQKKKNSWHQAIRVDITKYVKFFKAFFQDISSSIHTYNCLTFSTIFLYIPSKISMYIVHSTNILHYAFFQLRLAFFFYQEIKNQF